MADQEKSDIYVVFTMSWIKTIVSKFATLDHTALILGVLALRSHLKLICEYELHNVPNKTLVAQRIMVKTTSRSDRLWSAIFSMIIYSDLLITLIVNVLISLYSVDL